MQASKMNPKMRYFSQPKYSDRQNTWHLIQSFLRNPFAKSSKYPNLVEDHRKFMKTDFIKKVEEVKHLRERFSVSEKGSRTLNRTQRVYTDRSDVVRSDKRRQKMMRSAEVTRQHTQIVNTNTINKIDINSGIDQDTSRRKNTSRSNSKLSQFQKNLMKRLKTRQNMILKKKIDSLQYDSRRMLVINSMRLAQRSIDNKSKNIIAIQSFLS